MGMRMKNWKLVKYRQNKKSRNKGRSDSPPKEDWRLYDLNRDLSEERDLSSQHPEIVVKMKKQLKEDQLYNINTGR